jgi:hypothetical protein
MCSLRALWSVVDVRMYRSVDKPALVQAIDEAVRTRVAAKAATLPVGQHKPYAAANREVGGG